MRPNWPTLASLAHKTCTPDSFQFFGVICICKAGDKKSSNLHVSDCCAIIVAQCCYVYLNNYPTFDKMKHSLSLLI